MRDATCCIAHFCYQPRVICTYARASDAFARIVQTEKLAARIRAPVKPSFPIYPLSTISFYFWAIFASPRIRQYISATVPHQSNLQRQMHYDYLPNLIASFPIFSTADLCIEFNDQLKSTVSIFSALACIQSVKLASIFDLSKLAVALFWIYHVGQFI